MKKYILFLFSLLIFGITGCETEDPDSEKNITSESINNIFTPTIESWINTQSSMEWVHETDGEDLLTLSSLQEKYPAGVIYELEYLEHNEFGLPTIFEERYFSFGISRRTVHINYNEDNTVAGLIIYNEDDSFNHEVVFSRLDEQKRIVSQLSYNEAGEFLARYIYDYAEIGGREIVTRYNSESGNDEADLYGKWHYTFTSFGDIEHVLFIGGEQESRTESNYYYRNDKTLKNITTNSTTTGAPDYFSETTYNDQEIAEYQKVEYGNERWDYYYNVSNGNLSIVEYYKEEELKFVHTYAEDGSSERKIFNSEDEGYKIEFMDGNSSVFLVEYYDAEGNLLNTEEYSTNYSSSSNQKAPEVDVSLKELKREAAKMPFLTPESSQGPNDHKVTRRKGLCRTFR